MVQGLRQPLLSVTTCVLVKDIFFLKSRGSAEFQAPPIIMIIINISVVFKMMPILF